MGTILSNHVPFPPVGLSSVPRIFAEKQLDHRDNNIDIQDILGKNRKLRYS